MEDDTTFSTDLRPEKEAAGEKVREEVHSVCVTESVPMGRRGQSGGVGKCLQFSKRPNTKGIMSDALLFTNAQYIQVIKV